MKIMNVLSQAQPQSGGFSLVEVLISIALFAIIGVMINTILINTMSTVAKAQAIREVKQSGDFAMQVMIGQLRNATGVGTCTNGMSSIEFTNPDGTTTSYETIEDPPSSNQYKIISDHEGDIDVLTGGSDATVDQTEPLTFNCDPTTYLIEISYTLRHVTGVNDPFENRAVIPYSSSVLIRGIEG